MPTNEERREVAEKIRKMVEDRYNFTALNVADVIGVEEVVFDDRYAFDEACWLRLVDLIEPEPERTCHIVHGKCFHPQDEDRCLDKDNEFFGFDYWQDCEFYGCRRLKAGCSECGAVFKGGYLTKNNYCPNCGARVVE